LENLKGATEGKKVKVNGKKAAIFGSYGWDGAYIMEDLFKRAVQNIGFKVQPEVCVEVGTNIQYHPDDHLKKCVTFGKNFAEGL
jgi:flavorubredoxin